MSEWSNLAGLLLGWIAFNAVVAALAIFTRRHMLGCIILAAVLFAAALAGGELL